MNSREINKIELTLDTIIEFHGYHFKAEICTPMIGDDYQLIFVRCFEDGERWH